MRKAKTSAEKIHNKKLLCCKNYDVDSSQTSSEIKGGLKY